MTMTGMARYPQGHNNWRLAKVPDSCPVGFTACLIEGNYAFTQYPVNCLWLGGHVLWRRTYHCHILKPV